MDISTRNKILIISIVAFLTLFLIWHYIGVILSSAIISYLCLPFLKRSDRFVSRRTSSLILCMVVAILIIITVNRVMNFFLTSTDEIIRTLTFYSDRISEGLNAYTGYPVLGELLSKLLIQIGELIPPLILTTSTKIVRLLPDVLINLAIFLMGLFYFSKDGEYLVISLKKVVPDEWKEFIDALIFRGHLTLDGVIKSWFAIALFKTIVSFIGFYILGFSRPVLMGIVVGILELIPVIGPYIFWMTLVLIEILQFNYLIALLTFLFGLIFLTIIPDFYLKPKITAEEAEVNTMLIFIGFFAGITVFGISGIVLGPVILSLAKEVLDILKSSEELESEI